MHGEIGHCGARDGLSCLSFLLLAPSLGELMSQGGGVVLHGGCPSQELVPHQKSHGHHPAFDRAEVVSKTDFLACL